MTESILSNKDFIDLISGRDKSLIRQENNKNVVVIENKSFEAVNIVHSTTFSYEIWIQDCVINGNLEINAGSFLDRVLLKRIEIKNLVITGGDFAAGLFINDCQISDGISFYKQDNKFFKSASVSIENNSAKYIHVSNLDFEYINFSQNDTSSIYVSNTLIYPKTPDHPFQHLFSKIKYLNFGLKEKTKFTIEYQEVETLSFTGTLNSSEINMNEIRAGELTFNAFTKLPSGVLNLSRIRPLNTQSSVTIRNSFLGNSSFYDCNFAAFKSFAVANSYFIDLIYANTTWPKNISVANADKFTPSFYSPWEQKIQLRETFRQLKLAASKQGDKLQEAHFYRNEMVYLNKTLKTSTHFGSKLALILSLVSNNHRQSWILAIVWLLALNIIFVLTIDSFNGIHRFSWLIFFNLLNPAHRFGDLEMGKTSFNLLIDFLSRLINGFLIYQIIAAFRKLS